ncbi:E3 SUMO-protein ligase ZBED1-like isoform X2 [Wyeomyia smithii]|uniref:E3 SUMO-protein ligase ZBED1-like isoform X2 n=1 Tax=Wyeomyia smithii TaxID=174621 RepID=UPI0024680274|nr:E3 SUMO-protein ligase ZBED1-like isoform X2 [Wyeomyia smithii]
MQLHHPKELRAAESGASLSLSDSSKSDELQVGSHNNKIDSIVNKQNRQLSLRKYIKRSGAAYISSSNKKLELDRALTRFIIKDIQPLSIVDDTGFADFVRTLDPRYPMPSRRHLRDVLLDKAYNNTVGHIYDILRPIKFIAITFDGWTSRTTQSYLVITAHFLLDSGLAVVTLAVQPIQSRATSKNLKALVNSVLSKFPGVSVMCAVTDCGSNMIQTCELLKMRNMPCAAHKIQRIVVIAIAKTESFLDAKKEENLLEGLFVDDEYDAITHNDSSANRLLEQEMAKRGQQPMKLMQPCKTHWNSLFYLLESAQKIGDPLYQVLYQCDKWELKLNLAEEHLIPQILRILKPFVTATTKLSGDSYPTINLVIPTTKQILVDLENLQRTEENDLFEAGDTIKVTGDECVKIESRDALRFLEDIQTLTKERMMEYEIRTITGISTILDPRFKKHAFVSEGNYRTMAERLKEELKAEIVAANTRMRAERSDISISRPTKKGEYTFLDEVRTRTYTDSTIHTTAQAIVHLNNYMEEPLLGEQDDVLAYWTNYKACDPLRDIALRYLIVPASSVPSERVNSTAGNTITDKRARLSPSLAERLIFLNENFKFLKL